MFMSLLHTYYSEFMKFINRTLTVTSAKLSQEYISISNTHATQKSITSQIYKEFTELVQRYKRTKDTTFFYIYLNQFFIIFEKKFFDKLNDSFEELYHSGDL